MTDHTQPPPFNVGGPYYNRHNVVKEDGHHRFVTTPISMSETLTLRDQFAMAALTGLISDPKGNAYQGLPEKAYVLADLMLAAREQKK